MLLAASRFEEEGQEASASGSVVTAFTGADIAAQAAIASQDAAGKTQRLSTGLRTIPLASWTGSRLGPQRRYAIHTCLLAHDAGSATHAIYDDTICLKAFPAVVHWPGSLRNSGAM